MQYRVGVDVGGTFTDLVAMDEAGESSWPRRPRLRRTSPIGVVDAIAKAGIDLKDVPSSPTAPRWRPTPSSRTRAPGSRSSPPRASGTPRAAARPAGDRQPRRHVQPADGPAAGLRGRLRPSGRRPLRFEVPERLDYRGQVLKPLDEEAVRQIARGATQAGRRGGRHLLPVLVHEPGARAADRRDRARDASRAARCRCPARSCPSSASTSG